MIDPIAALEDIARTSTVRSTCPVTSSDLLVRLQAIHDRASGVLRSSVALAGQAAERNSVTITLTQDQAEHVLLCARMALAQAQLAALTWQPTGTSRDVAKRRDTFAGLVLALEAQITER